MAYNPAHKGGSSGQAQAKPPYGSAQPIYNPQPRRSPQPPGQYYQQYPSIPAYGYAPTVGTHLTGSHVPAQSHQYVSSQLSTSGAPPSGPIQRSASPHFPNDRPYTVQNVNPGVFQTPSPATAFPLSTDLVERISRTLSYHIPECRGVELHDIFINDTARRSSLLMGAEHNLMNPGEVVCFGLGTIARDIVDVIAHPPKAHAMRARGPSGSQTICRHELVYNIMEICMTKKDDVRDIGSMGLFGLFQNNAWLDAVVEKGRYVMSSVRGHDRSLFVFTPDMMLKNEHIRDAIVTAFARQEPKPDLPSAADTVYCPLSYSQLRFIWEYSAQYTSELAKCATHSMFSLKSRYQLNRFDCEDFASVFCGRVLESCLKLDLPTPAGMCIGTVVGRMKSNGRVHTINWSVMLTRELVLFDPQNGNRVYVAEFEPISFVLSGVGRLPMGTDAPSFGFVVEVPKPIPLRMEYIEPKPMPLRMEYIEPQAEERKKEEEGGTDDPIYCDNGNPPDNMGYCRCRPTCGCKNCPNNH